MLRSHRKCCWFTHQYTCYTIHIPNVFQVGEVSAESQVRYELETRFQQLQSRLSTETLETEEVRFSLYS